MGRLANVGFFFFLMISYIGKRDTGNEMHGENKEESLAILIMVASTVD